MRKAVGLILSVVLCMLYGEIRAHYTTISYGKCCTTYATCTRTLYG
jgi:hypothetical protein